MLRSGGLGIRDLKRTATALDMPESLAAFWLELAYAAGLLASDGEADERYAPTPAYDDWLRLPAERRWAALATAWLAATRTAGLAGTRTRRAAPCPRSARTWTARRARGATARTGVARRPAAGGSALPRTHSWPGCAGSGPCAAAPAGRPARPDLARWTLTEAEILGVTGRGALPRTRAPCWGRSRAPAPSTGPPGPPRNRIRGAEPREPGTGAHARRGRGRGALAPLLPEPLDHVLLQADLTAVAPGPLRRPLAEMLGVLADVESKGGATVYRFTPGSVRRALDAGRTAADLHAFLAEHSPHARPAAAQLPDRRRGPPPRPSAGRRGLGVRTLRRRRAARRDPRGQAVRGAAAAPAGADRAGRPGRAGRPAGGSAGDGLAPAAESADGDVLITRADAHRTPPRTRPSRSRTVRRRRTAHCSGPLSRRSARATCASTAVRKGPPTAPAVTAATAPHHRGRDPGHDAGRGADRRGGLDRLRERGRGREPAGHRARSGSRAVS